MAWPLFTFSKWLSPFTRYASSWCLSKCCLIPANASSKMFISTMKATVARGAALPVKRFREINLEVECFLAVGQFVNRVFNLLLVAVFLVLVRLVEVARLQFFEPLEQLLVEQSFLDAEQRVAGDDFVEQV